MGIGGDVKYDDNSEMTVFTQYRQHFVVTDSEETVDEGDLSDFKIQGRKRRDHPIQLDAVAAGLNDVNPVAPAVGPAAVAPIVNVAAAPVEGPAAVPPILNAVVAPIVNVAAAPVEDDGYCVYCQLFDEVGSPELMRELGLISSPACLFCYPPLVY